MLFHEVKMSVTEKRSKPGPGSYSVHGQSLEWTGCRERFSAFFKKDVVGIYFSVEASQGYRVASFIKKIESVLDLELKSVFHETNFNYVIYIRPSQFWMSCDVRRSLLTIFLRQGLQYCLPADNFDDALFGQTSITHDYAAATKPAIMRFLFGFTTIDLEQIRMCPVGAGWVSLFRGASTQQIRQKLIHSDGGDEGLIGAGKLWG